MILLTLYVDHISIYVDIYLYVYACNLTVYTCHFYIFLCLLRDCKLAELLETSVDVHDF